MHTSIHGMEMEGEQSFKASKDSPASSSPLHLNAVANKLLSFSLPPLPSFSIASLTAIKTAAREIKLPFISKATSEDASPVHKSIKESPPNSSFFTGVKVAGNTLSLFEERNWPTSLQRNGANIDNQLPPELQLLWKCYNFRKHPNQIQSFNAFDLLGTQQSAAPATARATPLHRVLGASWLEIKAISTHDGLVVNESDVDDCSPREAEMYASEPYISIAAAILKFDKQLAQVRFKQVPRKIRENVFWMNYFKMFWKILDKLDEEILSQFSGNETVPHLSNLLQASDVDDCGAIEMRSNDGESNQDILHVEQKLPLTDERIITEDAGPCCGNDTVKVCDEDYVAAADCTLSQIQPKADEREMSANALEGKIMRERFLDDDLHYLSGAKIGFDEVDELDGGAKQTELDDSVAMQQKIRELEEDLFKDLT